MHDHPEHASEQAYIDRAYAALEEMRATAELLRDSVIGLGSGGTFAARVERDVFVETSLRRLEHLDIGEEPLVFGRIDTLSGETFYIGRVAVAGPNREPLVVDWRAPVAEPFYRSTGRHPMGLRRRRHFLCQGRKLVGIADEHFSEAGDELGLVGSEALRAALDRTRTGRMRDIVATIQREQDEIIRSDMPGVLVVQGGPGTGKTAVALHRAAYLLFTHRYVLERDGVLVVGPNQLFLRYIEQVLPALGESGAALSTLAGLVPQLRVRGEDTAAVARVKGDLRMARVLARAVRDRERPLVRDASFRVGTATIRLTVRDSATIVSSVRRRGLLHNDGRRHVERQVLKRLHGRYADTFRGSQHELDRTLDELHAELRDDPNYRRTMDRMWPRLTGADLVHDLLGAPSLIASAAKGILSRDEQRLLHRPWSDRPREAPWTQADVALVDEAAALLGPLRRRGTPEDEIAAYGHLVVDEAQDLSPMELRMLTRRSRLGSMTVVGDLAQATTARAPGAWEDVLEHLPERHRRVAQLTVNYRTPREIMDLASRVLAEAAPGLEPPTSVRSSGEEPAVVAVPGGELGPRTAQIAGAEHQRTPGGTVAVITPAAAEDVLIEALVASGVPFAEARENLDAPVTVLPVTLAKGLEFDAVVVVEPAAILEEHGARALYVALTRATQRLTLVHARALPGMLSG